VDRAFAPFAKDKKRLHLPSQLGKFFVTASPPAAHDQGVGLLLQQGR
jgi:hypothetical protein